MKTLSKLSWAFVILLAVSPFAYFFLRLFGIPVLALLPSTQDQSFLDSTMGNWFATMLGLIAGIPIAFWINQKQTEFQEKERIESEKQVSQERKHKILALLRNELDTNRQYLNILIEKQNEQSKITMLAGMKNVLWRAFSDSGELHWIDDPTLIDGISTAYYNINALIDYESRYSDPYFNSSVSSSKSHTYAGENTVNNVKNLRPIALASISEAINSIDLEL